MDTPTTAGVTFSTTCGTVNAPSSPLKAGGLTEVLLLFSNVLTGMLFLKA